MARRASRCEHIDEPVFSGPATGLAGARGGDLAGAAPSGVQRSDLQAGQFAKRASVMHRMTDEEARAPRARERAAVVSPAGGAGLTVFA